MFSDLPIKRVFSLLSIVIITAAAGIVGYGQCTGVYSRRTSTQQIPYSKVYLSRAADITGDGKVDLLATQDISGSESSRERILIMPGNGDGTFGTAITIDAPIDFDEYFSYAKINGDALYDIVAFKDYSGEPTSSMYVYINNGNGTFTAKPAISAAGMGTPIDFADLNGDGKTDYVGMLSGGALRYSLGNGDGTFVSPVPITSCCAGVGGDFNGDGKRDFFGNKILYLNNGDLTFTATDLSSLFGNNETANYPRDLNGDGKTDLLLTNNSVSRYFAILTSTGTGFTRSDYTVSTDTNAHFFYTIGNFSGNSAPDMVYTATESNKKVVYTNDGAGNFTRQDLDQRLWRHNGMVPIQADFTSDGKDDLVWGNSGVTNSYMMFRDVSSISFFKTVCDRPGQPRVVDFDGSESTDKSYWDPATGEWSGISTTGSSTVYWGLGSLGDIPTPGDFDGDGVSDRAVYRNSTGYWYILRSSDQQWYTIQFGLPGDKPVAADYDGDSISDIAVWRPSDGTWYFAYMGTHQFAAVRWGMNGDKPVPADFDGDLKTDAAVFRPSTGIWYVLKSSDSSFAAASWGLSTDRPIPADFDGDGKADIAVHRESNSVAYILRSSNGTASYYQYGSPGDILQIGDFDGDFVSDLGVFRPSNRSWWYSISSFGSTGIYGPAGAIPTSSILRVE